MIDFNFVLPTNSADTLHHGAVIFFMDATESSDEKKHRNEIYDTTKQSRNVCCRQLYAQARDARRQHLHAQTRSFAVRYNDCCVAEIRIEEGHGGHLLELQGHTDSVVHHDALEAQTVLKIMKGDWRSG